MRSPKVCVLRAAGTNCDKETAFAFTVLGARADFVHINELKFGAKKLADYQILALSGGFSYGDDIISGKILANELKYKLGELLRIFIASGKLIIGICNGFQVLVRAGILPGEDGWSQEISLSFNDSGKFEDRWIYLTSPESRVPSSGKCVWTKDLPAVIYLPVAHGEGKFIAQDKIFLEKLKRNGQVVFQYCDEAGGLRGYPFNPNGSQGNIAGICDLTGRILGLMPHPERHSFGWQNPFWTRQGLKKEGDGLKIFRNGVEYVKKYL